MSVHIYLACYCTSSNITKLPPTRSSWEAIDITMSVMKPCLFLSPLRTSLQQIQTARSQRSAKSPFLKTKNLVTVISATRILKEIHKYFSPCKMILDSPCVTRAVVGVKSSGLHTYIYVSVLFLSEDNAIKPKATRNGNNIVL